MNQNNNIRAIIAGGGTGGHIFPAVAIANAIKKHNANNEILFVGALGKMEMEKVPKEGYKIIGLPIAGFNRSSIFKNYSLPFKLINSFLQARKIIKNFKPNVVIGVGGYASFPMLFMAQNAGIATLIQEANSFAGKSNIILGKKASSVCVAYDGMDKFFKKEKIHFTGNPIRENIANSTVAKKEAILFFNLNEDKKTILVIGGSLGAKSINDTLKSQYKIFLENGFQVIWQTGALAFESSKNCIVSYEENIKVFDFIQQMDKAYAAADIIISRAGAMSIAELCIVAKPVVFVPLPTAAEDHQTTNALALVKKNAAILIRNVDTDNELVKKTIALLNDEKTCAMYSSNLKNMAITNAVEKIYGQIKLIVN